MEGLGFRDSEIAGPFRVVALLWAHPDSGFSLGSGCWELGLEVRAHEVAVTLYLLASAGSRHESAEGRSPF